MGSTQYVKLSRELWMASLELSNELSKKNLSELTAIELQFLKTVDKVNEAYLNENKAK